MSSKAQIIRKLQAYNKNPDLIKEVSNTELADLVLVVMRAVQAIDEAIKEGRLDGYSPQPDKDYVSAETTRKMLKAEVDKMLAQTDSVLSTTSTELERRVQQAIENIRNGNDGIVTEAEIQRAADIAYTRINAGLPDFDKEITKAITSNGETVRNSLELLNGDERLEQSAIKNLTEDLRQLQEQIARINLSVQGVGGTSRNLIDSVILQRIADGTISTGTGVNVETPSGTIDGVNTAFTVANEPKYVVVNTLTYFAGGGYTYASGTITFDIPPATGSVIRSIY